MNNVPVENGGEEERMIEDLRNLDPSREPNRGFLPECNEAVRDLGNLGKEDVALGDFTGLGDLFGNLGKEDGALGDFTEFGDLFGNLGKEDFALGEKDFAAGDFTGFGDLFGNLGKEDFALGEKDFAAGDFTGFGDLFGNLRKEDFAPGVLTGFEHFLGSDGVNQDAAFGEFTGVGDLDRNTSHGSSQIQSQAPSHVPSEDPSSVTSQGTSIVPSQGTSVVPSQGTSVVPSQVPAQHDNDTAKAGRTQLLADKTSFKKIADEVFTENIKWFEVDRLIPQGVYESEDTNKKILNSKIKVRVLSGYAVVPVGEESKARWVVGVDVYATGSETLDDLRAYLRSERLPLPPAYTFWSLAHSRLGENLSLIENGITDGDVILLCRQPEWKVKVLLPMDIIEVIVSPLSTVAELKRILILRADGLSAPDNFYVTSGKVILDDMRSLESQMVEGQCLRIRAR